MTSTAHAHSRLDPVVGETGMSPPQWSLVGGDSDAADWAVLRRQPDEHAFAAIFDRHRKAVYTFAFRGSANGCRPRTPWPPSTRPWSLISFPGRGSAEKLTSGGHAPAHPQSSSLAKGECASGWITFREPEGRFDSFSLVHENSFGERAVWIFH